MLQDVAVAWAPPSSGSYMHWASQYESFADYSGMKQSTTAVALGPKQKALFWGSKRGEAPLLGSEIAAIQPCHSVVTQLNHKRRGHYSALGSKPHESKPTLQRKGNRSGVGKALRPSCNHVPQVPGPLSSLSTWSSDFKRGGFKTVKVPGTSVTLRVAHVQRNR